MMTRALRQVPPDSSAHLLGKLDVQDAVSPEQRHGVVVVTRRPPALGRAAVLRDVDARLAGRKVYLTPDNHIGSVRRRASAADSPCGTATGVSLPACVPSGGLELGEAFHQAIRVGSVASSPG